MGDAKQVVVKQLRRAAPVPLRSRLLVAPQLAHRLGLPHVQQRRRLGLHHHQRDAVDEQRQVRFDDSLIILVTRAFVAPADTELRSHNELVEAALRVVEVEEADGAGIAAARPVHSQGHAVGQVLVDGLVAGHARGVDVLQVED